MNKNPWLYLCLLFCCGCGARHFTDGNFSAIERRVYGYNDIIMKNLQINVQRENLICSGTLMSNCVDTCFDVRMVFWVEDKENPLVILTEQHNGVDICQNRGIRTFRYNFPGLSLEKIKKLNDIHYKVMWGSHKGDISPKVKIGSIIIKNKL